MTRHDVKTTLFSHQNGKQRYPSTDQNDRRPRIAHWRNNLTALSQYRNLYFVAYLDVISVFEPDFPNQRLGDPTGTIQLPASRPDLEGYLDDLTPQAANQLLVKDLGEEEILLAVCDSGDAIGYTIRSILQAFDRQEAPLFVSPFFHENVGASAWGIDVHKTSRLIAVSSNTHDILIFAFALSREGKEAILDEFEDADYSVNQLSRWRQAMPFVGAPLSSMWRSLGTAKLGGANCTKRHHKNNYAWILRGHDTNIPNIAFLRTDTDETVYLASIDIDGRAKVWDVWRAEEIVAVSIPSRGWAVACLDHRQARIVTTQIDTYGCTPKIASPKPFVDNSGCTSLLTQNSHWHPGYSKFSTVSTPQANQIDDAAEDLQEFDEEDEFLADENDEISSTASSESDLSNESSSAHSDIHDTLHNQEPFHNTKQGSNQPQSREKLNSLLCPIFFTGEKDVVLFERLCPGNTSRHISDHDAVCCRDALSQNIPPGMTLLRRIERLNMTQQIPELGILVVGNQAGRVGLFQLTYRPDEQRYGFKIETILPLLTQEKHGMRPEAPLLGMAVGPMQGCGEEAHSPSQLEGKWDPRARRRNVAEEGRRYRLLLMYYDHTVLAYEISRNSNGILLF